MMVYDEDLDLPEWVKDPLGNKDDLAFNKWYRDVFGCNPSPRSARYYQMRRAWMGAKKHYMKTRKE